MEKNNSEHLFIKWEDNKMMRIGISGSKSFFGPLHCLDHAYSTAIIKAGFIPIILPLLENLTGIREMLEGLDGLILSGGYDIWPFFYGENPHKETAYFLPQRDLFELALYKTARQMNIPVFGVCRGLQIVNVAQGGTLIQDIHSQRESPIRHAPADDRIEAYHKIHCEGRLVEILGENAVVNSVHHQAIKDLGKDLRILAKSEDHIIEAVETTDQKVLAVQFHPERTWSGLDMPNLFYYFFGEKR